MLDLRQEHSYYLGVMWHPGYRGDNWACTFWYEPWQQRVYRADIDGTICGDEYLTLGADNIVGHTHKLFLAVMCIIVVFVYQYYWDIGFRTVRNMVLRFISLIIITESGMYIDNHCIKYHDSTILMHTFPDLTWTTWFSTVQTYDCVKLVDIKNPANDD